MLHPAAHQLRADARAAPRARASPKSPRAVCRLPLSVDPTAFTTQETDHDFSPTPLLLAGTAASAVIAPHRNNAGLTSIIAPLLRMEDEQWARDLGVNLTGPFNTIRAVLPGMVQRRWGRIVNISSMAARAGLWRQAGYSASKAGLLGLTRNVALEHAADGITCNAVLPGLIETPAVAKLPQPVMDHAMSLTPARRTGRTDEVAALVAFLLSDDAAYLNGAEIDIDGGSHLCPVVLGSVREVQARRDYRHPPQAGDNTLRAQPIHARPARDRRLSWLSACAPMGGARTVDSRRLAMSATDRRSFLGAATAAAASLALPGLAGRRPRPASPPPN